MRTRFLAAALVLSAIPAFAQTNPAPDDQGRPVGTGGQAMKLSPKPSNLPGQSAMPELSPRLPAAPENADAAQLLAIARSALAAGQTGAAQEALERAETRVLDRSVPPSQAHTPSADPAVTALGAALAALGAGDVAAAQRQIDAAEKLLAAPATR